MVDIHDISKESSLIFSQEGTPTQEGENSSHISNPGILFPLLIIVIGLFQYILRKWLAPVSDEAIQELEDKIPTQSLIYLPQFGIFLMVGGVILLVVLNY